MSLPDAIIFVLAHVVLLLAGTTLTGGRRTIASSLRLTRIRPELDQKPR